MISNATTQVYTPIGILKFVSVLSD